MSKYIVFGTHPKHFCCGSDYMMYTNSAKNIDYLAGHIYQNGISRYQKPFVENVFCIPFSRYTQKVCEMGLEEYNLWAENNLSRR